MSRIRSEGQVDQGVERGVIPEPRRSRRRSGQVRHPHHAQADDRRAAAAQGGRFQITSRPGGLASTGAARSRNYPVGGCGVCLTGWVARTASERIWPVGFRYTPQVDGSGVLVGRVGRMQDLLAWIASCEGACGKESVEHGICSFQREPRFCGSLFTALGGRLSGWRD